MIFIHEAAGHFDRLLLFNEVGAINPAELQMTFTFSSEESQV